MLNTPNNKSTAVFALIVGAILLIVALRFHSPFFSFVVGLIGVLAVVYGARLFLGGARAADARVDGTAAGTALRDPVDPARVSAVVPGHGQTDSVRLQPLDPVVAPATSLADPVRPVPADHVDAGSGAMPRTVDAARTAVVTGADDVAAPRASGSAPAPVSASATTASALAPVVSGNAPAPVASQPARPAGRAETASLDAYRRAYPSNFSQSGPTCHVCGNTDVVDGTCRSCGAHLYEASA